MVFLFLLIIFSEILNILTATNVSSIYLYEKQQQKRSILKDKSKMWAEKEILYYVDPRLDHTLIKVALYRISRETCLTFKRVTVRRKALFVYLRGERYRTNLGKGKEIPHKIFVPFFFEDIGKTIRETMYALGVDYEHNRWDRDFYVRVYINNIQPQFREYFRKNNDSFTTFGSHYDLRSVMHFSLYEYGESGQKVIESGDNLMAPFLGKSQHLTFLDARTLNKKYCTYPYIEHPNCLLFGYQHPRTPTRCKCLPFLTGDACQTVIPNGNLCTQQHLFIVTPETRHLVLNVGGKCSFVFETLLERRIKFHLKFINTRQRSEMICTTENSIEIKTNSYLTVSGYLFCPNGRSFIFKTRHRMFTIVANFPPSNLQLRIIYRSVF